MYQIPPLSSCRPTSKASLSEEDWEDGKQLRYLKLKKHKKLKLFATDLKSFWLIYVL